MSLIRPPDPYEDYLRRYKVCFYSIIVGVNNNFRFSLNNVEQNDYTTVLDIYDVRKYWIIRE